jgi:hypothetical protein
LENGRACDIAKQRIHAKRFSSKRYELA